MPLDSSVSRRSEDKKRRRLEEKEGQGWGGGERTWEEK